MKALVLEKYNQVSYKEVPTPQIGPEDVLVRVKACAICGSDIHGVDGSTGRRQPPIIMGHEASGVIKKTGGNVSDFKPGDRVTFDSTIYCRKCYFCKRGLINLCDERVVIGISCDDYHRDGAMAEYIAVPEHIVYRLPDTLTFEQASLAEPLSIAMHAVNLTPVELNDTAVVFGVGTIGLLVVQLLSVSGCGEIIAVDSNEHKFELAKECGADITLKANTVDVVEEILKLTNNRGADLAIEAVGVNQTFKAGIHCLRKGGVFTLIGNLSPSIEFPLQLAVIRQIKIIGSCSSSGEYNACLNLLTSGAVNVDCLISKIVALSEGKIWFQKLKNSEPGLMKVVLRP